jgi:hypothetical protein
MGIVGFTYSSGPLHHFKQHYRSTLHTGGVGAEINAKVVEAGRQRL